VVAFHAATPAQLTALADGENASGNISSTVDTRNFRNERLEV
jgi:hypothetical protein